MPDGSFGGAGLTTGLARPGFVAPLPERVMELTGVDTIADETVTQAPQRSWVAETLEGLATRGGSTRSTRIRSCGRSKVVLTETEEGTTLERRVIQCRDRLCPYCAKVRAAKLGDKVRESVESRLREGLTDLVFVTLTQPKLHDSEESCREAIDRASNSLRKLWARRPVKHVVEGGVRATEVVWQEAGTQLRNGYVIRYSGWHVHHHMILEATDGNGSGAALEAVIRKAWSEVSPGSSDAAQHFAPVRMETCREIAKYPLKPFETRNPFKFREAAEALANRKMFVPVGAWRPEFKKDEAPKDPHPRWVSSLTVASLVRDHDHFGSNHPVEFTHWDEVEQKPVVRCARVSQVLIALLTYQSQPELEPTPGELLDPTSRVPRAPLPVRFDYVPAPWTLPTDGQSVDGGVGPPGAVVVCSSRDGPPCDEPGGATQLGWRFNAPEWDPGPFKPYQPEPTPDEVAREVLSALLAESCADHGGDCDA